MIQQRGIRMGSRRWITFCWPRRLGAALPGRFGAVGGRQHRRHHRPQRPAQPDRRLRLAGGHLHRRHRRPAVVATPGQFFERRGRPPERSASPSSSSSTANRPAARKTGRGTEDVRVDLPVGLSVNPGATPRCDLATFEASAANCDAVGVAGRQPATVTAAARLVGIAAADPAGRRLQRRPKDGEPARFGLELLGQRSLPRRRRRLGQRLPRGLHDRRPESAANCRALEGLILKNRLVFDGTAGDGTFITTPSTCLGEAFPGPSGSVYSTYLRAASYAEEESAGYQFPRDAEPALRVADPARHLAERMQHDPLRPGARRRPRDGS